MQINDAVRSAYNLLTTELLPSAALNKLAALGINTLEELRDYWTYGNRELIISYLGTMPLRFLSAPPSSSLAMKLAAGVAGGSVLDVGRAPALIKRPRGIILSAKQLNQLATAPTSGAVAAGAAASSFNAKISLVDRFPAVRNQEQRGTCVAFSSIAYLEFHLSQAAGKKVPRHSEQFFYWACKSTDGIPNMEGTFVSTAQSVLQTHGACLNKTWAYNPLPIAGNEGQGPAPNGADAEASKSTWKAKKVAASNVDRICAQLDAGMPVVLSVKTFRSWDFATTADTGDITMPFPGERSDGGHAICLVGYGADKTAPGGGRVIFRNSWGKTWAKNSRSSAGYGTLPYEYIKKYSLEAYS